MIKLVLATNNAHKVSEFRSCFAQKGFDVEILTIKETGFDGEIVEDADSFEGNAYIKAKALCDYLYNENVTSKNLFSATPFRCQVLAERNLL